MRLFYLAAALVLTFSAQSAAAQQACPQGTGPVTVYFARKIITMDTAAATATAVAVDDTLIAAVGDSADFVGAQSAGCTIDRTYQQQVLMPGFVEAHTHLQLYGLFARVPYVGYYDRPGPNGTTLRGITTWEGVRDTLTALANASPAPTTLFAYGVDPIYWDTRLTADSLNAISTTVPILLQLGSGHIVVGNDTMIALVRQQASWQAMVDSGYVVMEADGSTPTGELDELMAVEAAFEAIHTAGNEFLTLEAFGQAVSDGAMMMQGAGITTATEMAFGLPHPLARIWERGLYNRKMSSLPMRVVLAYNSYVLQQSGGNIASILRRAKQRDTPHVWTGPLKVVFDGSIQGYTARVDSGYYDPAGTPNPIWNVGPGNPLYDLIQPVWAAGFSIAIHVNGDQASEEALAVIQEATDSAAQNRVTLEHDQMATLEDFVATAKAGVTVNLFTPHLYYYGDQHRTITLGPERAARMNNAYWADSLGIPFSLHSDAPVTPAQPLFAAWTAVARTTPSGAVLGPEYGIPVERALWAITMGGATLLGLQDRIGSITLGKLADFVVLDTDPTAVPDLRTVNVCATVFLGQPYPVTGAGGACPGAQ
ncbi:MAG TPA: amidohydrolase family protein [Longimicrobium sp.]|nr:amidohydrolase family protein [Longimicrobium sp.]